MPAPTADGDMYNLQLRKLNGVSPQNPFCLYDCRGLCSIGEPGAGLRVPRRTPEGLLESCAWTRAAQPLPVTSQSETGACP
jgi:hypothetical protein